MRRQPALHAQQLEEREVPAAAMFADIHPDIWGSYPLNLTASGDTLFFSADNGHGYELYATDGTPGSVHMAKDIKPGLGGSNPWNFISAGNGVVFFDADDGTGTALWRSDGTAAGTVKVPPIPAGDTLGSPYAARDEVGLNGKLFYLVTDGTTGLPQLWVTDGTTNTKLMNVPSPGWEYPEPSLGVANGMVTLSEQVINWTDVQNVWVTDGTPGGTRLQQVPLDPTPLPHNTEPETTFLPAGIEVTPGLLVHPVVGSTTVLMSSDGLHESSIQTIASISNTNGATAQDFVSLGGRLYFIVDSPDANTAGLWVTDGTAAGTHRLNVSFGSAQPVAIQGVGGKLLITTGPLSVLDQTSRPIASVQYWLTDGTAAGTTQVQTPAGATGVTVYEAAVPPDSAHAGGLLIFQNAGKLWVTDVKTGQSAWVDTTGLPTGYTAPPTPASVNYLYYTSGDELFEGNRVGTYFKGALYFSAANGDQRAELWKWDLPTATAAPVPPTVTSVVINDGSAQRSMVTSITVTFDRVVDIPAGSVTLVNNSGPVRIEYHPDLQLTTVGGRTVMTMTFGAANGGSLVDGRYTMVIPGKDVTDVATGGVMASDYAYSFTRLFGDLDGDGVYDRDARVLVHNALGQHVGQSGYIAALDVNRDGVIDGTDELAVVRNWGKSV